MEIGKLSKVFKLIHLLICTFREGDAYRPAVIMEGEVIFSSSRILIGDMLMKTAYLWVCY